MNQFNQLPPLFKFIIIALSLITLVAVTFATTLFLSQNNLVCFRSCVQNNTTINAPPIQSKQVELTQPTPTQAIPTPIPPTPTPTPIPTPLPIPTQKPAPNILGTWIGYQTDCGHGEWQCGYELIVSTQQGDSFSGTECNDYSAGTNGRNFNPDTGASCAAIDGGIDNQGNMSWTTHGPSKGTIALNYTDTGQVSGNTIKGSRGLVLSRS